jgi:anti-sigma B factor antagonist
MPDKVAEPVLTVDVEQVGAQATVRCHGRLVSGVDGILYAKVKQLIPGSKRIVLDLSDLSHMDSMGLGALVRLYVSCKSAGCELVLINLARVIKRLLGLTDLLKVFTVIGENGIKMM